MLSWQNNLRCQCLSEMRRSIKSVRQCVTHTGADITVADKAIRDVIGRDRLPNAEGSLQGCTGTTDDRRKDKLRVVTAEKKVVILELRIVDELGKGAPAVKPSRKQ